MKLMGKTKVMTDLGVDEVLEGTMPSSPFSFCPLVLSL